MSISSHRKASKKYSRKVNGTTKESLSRSATWKGRRAEVIALSLLSGSVDNNAGVLNKDFDISWNGFRVDVKSCNLYKRKNPNGMKKGSWWVFNKNKGQSDFYLCIGMVENIPERVYLIPQSAFGKGITIGYGKSKFTQYLFSK